MQNNEIPSSFGEKLRIAAISAAVGVLFSILPSLLVGVLSADPQGDNLFSKASRGLTGTEINQIESNITGALCTNDGADLQVKFTGFQPGEEVKIYYKYVESGKRASSSDEIQLNDEGKGATSPRNFKFDDKAKQCGIDVPYQVDVEVYRERSTDSTRSWIMLETGIPRYTN